MPRGHAPGFGGRSRVWWHSAPRPGRAEWTGRPKAWTDCSRRGSPVSNSRNSVGGLPGRLLEQPAEVQLVVVPDLAGDLLHRPEGVQQLPLRVVQHPLADQLGQRLAEVLLDQPAERLRRGVEEVGVVGRGVQPAVVLLHQLAQLRQRRAASRRRRCRTPTPAAPASSRVARTSRIFRYDSSISAWASPVAASSSRIRAIEVTDLPFRRPVEGDGRDAVRVVEQDAVAPDLVVVRLDAQEVGVEPDGRAPGGRASGSRRTAWYGVKNSRHGAANGWRASSARNVPRAGSRPSRP